MQLTAAERPYLIYPLGDFDSPAENLIAFNGISPCPRRSRGHGRKRALVTIEFFKLDNLARKNLLRERAWLISVLYELLTQRTARARKLIKGATLSSAPHTNCARSFVALFSKDRSAARAFADKATAIMRSIS